MYDQLLILVLNAQQTQNIFITFKQRRPNVFDVGPTLYKCYTNVLSVLGGRICRSIKWQSKDLKIFP